MNMAAKVRSGSWKGAKVLVLSPTPTHPQDFGNRKRIYATCRNLQKRGAKVVFLHYPSEMEWRSRIPRRAEAAMIREWDGYHLLPVTRELHMPPMHDHHMVDEWWDDYIGPYLTWLFSIENFDAFIVNYTWLSKALEFAPPSVVRILDTHDKFGGRKELLERNGLAPEFFYTTEEQEVVALERADVVWAIKEHERIEFQRLTQVPVLTMLHLDERRALPVPPPDEDGYLRVGVIGARNNINVTNLRAFMTEAIPVFEKYFAPIRLVVAGSVCGLLDDVDTRFVVKKGEIADVMDFYREIDIACIPMRFSTGLKIKTGEAISLGFPVISLAHAFEGYPPQHAYHGVANFREMAEKLVALAFDRDILQDLRVASVRARNAIALSIDECFDETLAIVQGKKHYIFYCADARALMKTGPLRAILESATRYLGMLSDIVIVVVSGPVEALARDCGDLKGGPRVVVAEDLIKDPDTAAALESHGIAILRFGEAVARFRPDLVVADAVCRAMANPAHDIGTLVYRAEPAAHGTGAPDPVAMAEIARAFRKTIVVGAHRSAQIEALGGGMHADTIAAPCMWRSDTIHEQFRGRWKRKRNVVPILRCGDAGAAALVCKLLVDLQCEPVLVGLAPPDGALPSPARAMTAMEYVDAIFAGAEYIPGFCLDLSFGKVGLQLAREVLQRLSVPVIVADTRLVQPAMAGSLPSGRASTFADLFVEISAALGRDRDAEEEFLHASQRELHSDGGWAWLWSYLTKLRGDQFEEFV